MSTAALAGYAASFMMQTRKKATLTTTQGDNKDLTFKAVPPGTAGNGISIIYADPSANNSPLSVEVDVREITVSLATGSGGGIVTTAAEIMAAVNAHDEAARWVVASLATGSNGSGVVAAMGSTSLSGGSTATTESFTDVVLVDLGDHIHYQAAAIADRYWIPGETLTIEEQAGGIGEFAEITTGFTIDYYRGLVTFDVAQDPDDNFQASGTKAIMEVVCAAYDFEVSPEIDMKDVTTFCSGGHREFKPGLVGGSGSVSDYWVAPGHSGDLRSPLIAAFYINTDTGRHRMEAEGYLEGAPTNASVGEVVSSRMTWRFTGKFYLWKDETYG
jgi:hypothetical protein